MNLAILIGSIFVIFIAYKYFQVKYEPGDDEAAKIAESYGVKVERVSRLVPVTEELNLSYKLEERVCLSCAWRITTQAATGSW